MRVSRVYYPVDIKRQQLFEVSGKTHHYLSRVLRLHKGHEVRLFNGSGQEFLCTVVKSNQRITTLICRDNVKTLSEPDLKIKLYLAVCKNESMDFSVQKATELNIQELQPLISKRSLTRRIAAKRSSHWHGVAASACEQCGRAIIPRIKEPIALTEVTQISKDDKAIICCFNIPTPIKTYRDALLAKPFNQQTIFHLMIGPEGGFDSNEIADAMLAGFEPARLGDYVLRTETAVTVALGITRNFCGI